jgi:hypothetical protein
MFPNYVYLWNEVNGEWYFRVGRDKCQTTVAANGAGNFSPPMLIFPIVYFKN